MPPISDFGKTEIVESAKTLFGPGGNELGQLIADQVRFWRWRSAIKIMKRAAEIRDAEDINSKKISLKFFLPFIEEASKENEESEITELWANLLASSDSSTVGFDLVCVEILKSIGSDEARFLNEIWQSGKEYGSYRKLFMEDMIDDYEINKYNLYKDIISMSAKVREYDYNIDQYFNPLLRQVVMSFRLNLYANPFIFGDDAPCVSDIENTTDLYANKLGSIITLEKLDLITNHDIAFDFKNEEVLIKMLMERLSAPNKMRDLFRPHLDAKMIILTEHGRGFMERCTRKDDAGKNP